MWNCVVYIGLGCTVPEGSSVNSSELAALGEGAETAWCYWKHLGKFLLKNAWMGLKGVFGSLLLKQAGNGW